MSLLPPLLSPLFPFLSSSPPAPLPIRITDRGRLFTIHEERSRIYCSVSICFVSLSLSSSLAPPPSPPVRTPYTLHRGDMLMSLRSPIVTTRPLSESSTRESFSLRGDLRGATRGSLRSTCRHFVEYRIEYRAAQESRDRFPAL